MSVAEMKLFAIAEIGKLNDEHAIKEILEHIAKISGNTSESFNVDNFFRQASEKYDDVLKKLAQ